MNFKPLIRFLDECLPELSIPGSDTVIYRGHEEIFRYRSGFDSLRDRTPVREDAIYNMYSVTKVSLAISALQLIQRGEILLTDPLYAYFPEYRNMSVRRTMPDGSVRIDGAKNPILIKHLLSMTAGFSYNLNRQSINQVRELTDGRCPTLDIVRALAADPLDFEPGERYQYSLCHDVMGGVIELVSGMRLSEYMRANIFEPLGLTDTGFRLSDARMSRLATQYNYDVPTRSAIEIPKTQNQYRLGTEYDSGGAGLYSTVRDQILIADMLTHRGVGKNGVRILSSSAVDLMRKNLLNDSQLATFRMSKHHMGYGYACGVRTNMNSAEGGNLMPEGEFGWDGAKLSYLSACPESRISIFHAEHMGFHHQSVIPRLRNVIYSCLD
ncbi:MAG: beta-lactamase family protein [Clostridia bacterium]|nr:beta-lactamase family protein [Clostridia bacterium]